ncbi:diaminohydroxyphosphoribosylaminopyrimidine reductase [Sulfolobus sp. A20]|nr:diaminohydroxyphosphoribosylaminopyrimidine reductase [Sulfolobus sp. A20]TRM82427.1 2,5-diamino-6-(ribosylamino)-4(3H)-pyrimidinone 5'-phosphate reductase [Sulfolobus sp. F3]TRM83481.1 2,5-diamino-6-(ribosylamino)-4(3H)-pyrimidinone 5'-phosphate reductase [Sulfolobus sp. A20-N-F6]TRM86944.1 2,5-diamino-6-(ribosylamino)-4(3H)-pyrimidinone 5'-phosphate reductase [Sulfolobus sp. E3]TRM95207.1 2,5-diamino-6-(ribosylamino)-4(3H)-pyrimidinone 5'-phosphate reductase [Sulfolobus sp. A20-N-G8]TRM98
MRPYIIIFSTVSIDGRLATKTGYSELSCPYDKQRQHELRTEVDGIMVGANTVRVDNPSLTIKYAKRKDKDPLRVIVSKSLNLDPSYKIFSVPPPTIVYTMNLNSHIGENLKKKGVIIRTFSEFKEIFEDLYTNFNVKKLMVEGGGNLIWSIIKNDLYDEIRLTVSPRIFGNGVSFAQGEGYIGNDSPKLRLVDFKLCECGNEVHLIYKKQS